MCVGVHVCGGYVKYVCVSVCVGVCICRFVCVCLCV